MFFHWHGDTFDLPAGARAIGSGAVQSESSLTRGLLQGFLLGRHGVALQFHAEVNGPILEGWLAEYEKDLPRGPGVMNADELRAGARAHGPALQARCHAFLAAWLDELLPAR
jgi:GMP synthase (glutamine-hydrolysing)